MIVRKILYYELPKDSRKIDVLKKQRQISELESCIYKSIFALEKYHRKRSHKSKYRMLQTLRHQFSEWELKQMELIC